MSGQQAYIYQKNNKIPDAAISASVSPSAKPPLVYPISKKGNGNISFYGQYDGSVDARYLLRILDTSLEVPIVSAPVFRGAGTGKMSGVSVSGLQAQKINVLCLSTGTDTTKAEVEIEGLRFRSKLEGSGGNAIYIIIDDSMLQFTLSDYSTIKDLKVGDTALEGQEWDFDTKVIQGDIIPADAHRVSFGQDELHIYTQYKKFETGRWKYYFIPEIRYEVKAGSGVYFVTGGRKITVTDGVTTEEYLGVVSIADFWQKVKDSSNLIEPVDSSIDTSRHYASPAVREFATKTDAYFLPPYRSEKSSEYAGELSGVWVNNNAKTELVEIKCIDNSYLGAEVWTVKGSSSGDLGEAQTGLAANLGHMGFTIPQKFPEDWDIKIKEDWSHEVVYASRDQNVTPPAICFAMKLGINSVPQQLEIEYKKKPPSCVCPPVRFSDRCLGLEEEGGEMGMAYTVPDLVYWTEVIFDIKIEQAANSESSEGRPGTSNYPWNTLLNTAKSASREYLSNFKTLAQRIMALPEDDTATLESIVSQYKQLVDSFSFGSLSSYYDSEADTRYYRFDEVTYSTSLYQSVTEAVLTYEKTYGVKKNSVTKGSSCYIEGQTGDYYWEVRGSKAYLPAFTDTPYYSTVVSGEEYVDTKEFAFLISTPCGGALKEGDTIIVTIGGSELQRTYQIGDITYLPTIAKQNLYLSGGVDGDDTYVWGVKGEINSFPDYLLNRNNPESYVDPNLSFIIEDGIIPFQVGDVFEFAVEGGHWIWKKDGGSWSSAKQISDQLQAFDSNLQIRFEFGVNPSFVQNDEWEILCVQENRASNLAVPWAQRYKGTGNIVFAFASQVTIDCLVIDLHDLTGTITFQASNESDFSILEHDEVITVTDLICKLYLGTEITAQYYRLLISGEHQVGYVFLGSVMQLSLDADSVRPLRRYQLAHQESKEPFSLYSHLKRGFTVEYSSFIQNADFVKLDEMIDYLKSNNDMPFYFLANVNYPDKLCIRARIDTDNIEPGSDIDLNAPEDKRIYSLTLPVVGVR